MDGIEEAVAMALVEVAVEVEWELGKRCEVGYLAARSSPYLP